MKKKWLLVGIVLILSLVVYVTYATSGLTILIYGKKMTSDISAKLENGTILVPLCVIAENLN
ncbi:copper amine oxidase N-terminal domain-containing protein, partial [Brevibacillus laterosporus]|nr:copper amine oxidase N-terminal domain-containing protein [Brevibacillus laterosporus]